MDKRARKKRLFILVPFLLVEVVNGSVAYQHQQLLNSWEGWTLLLVPLVMGIIALALPIYGSEEGELGADGAVPSSPVSSRDEEQPGGASTVASDKEVSTREDTSTAPEPSPQPHDIGEGAVQIMAILQQEGRLVDFLMEDISPYSDEQVGAAARDVHEKCRRAVKEVFGLKPVLPADEGSRVEVDDDFDPAKIRLIGKIQGNPPFRGVLRHAGWRCTRVELPSSVGKGGVIAPAEVEV